MVDDLGCDVPVPARVGRVVSIVPSLTEAVARTAPGLLVGATDWCTHPSDLDVRRVRGTKNPDVDAIVALAPDLVVANQEENRAGDLDALRTAGVAVWVTDIRTVDGAFASLTRMLAACDLDRPAWLDEAQAAWRDLPEPAVRRRAVVPIWRRPWMAVGRDTFTGAVLARLGVDNVLAGSAERYPRFDPADLPPHDLVVLPDEPYLFTADDGPEAFPDVSAALVSGRLLTWYGPSLTEAARTLPAALTPRHARSESPTRGRGSPQTSASRGLGAGESGSERTQG
jgi:ABC-type Fe3+-hydroxamate transport system substrate-binding protein